MKLWPILVFYDGGCSVCTRQARHWDVHDRRGRLEFVDIAAQEFDAEEYGRDPEAVEKTIHVKTADGRVFTGIDGVRVIWSAFPEMWGPAFLSGLPGIHGIMDLGYRTLAGNRHLLSGSCDDGFCAVEEEGETRDE